MVTDPIPPVTPDGTWTCAALPDGRRGLWFRVHDGRLEIRAGREGDDDVLSTPIGERPSAEFVPALIEVLETLAYAHDLARDRVCEPCRAWMRRGAGQEGGKSCGGSRRSGDLVSDDPDHARASIAPHGGA